MLVEYISFEFIIYLAYFKQLFSIAVSMYIHQYLFFIYHSNIAQFHQFAQKLFHFIKLSRNIHVTNWLGSMYISNIHAYYMILSLYTKCDRFVTFYLYFLVFFLFYLGCCLLSVCITLQDYCSQSIYIIVQQTE